MPETLDATLWLCQICIENLTSASFERQYHGQKNVCHENCVATRTKNGESVNFSSVDLLQTAKSFFQNVD